MKLIQGSLQLWQLSGIMELYENSAFKIMHKSRGLEPMPSIGSQFFGN